MKLDVYFNDDDMYDGYALLEENLITNECKLLLKENIYLGEIEVFINKAVELLKKRYEKVEYEIHFRND